MLPYPLNFHLVIKSSPHSMIYTIHFLGTICKSNMSSLNVIGIVCLNNISNHFKLISSYTYLIVFLKQYAFRIIITRSISVIFHIYATLKSTFLKIFLTICHIFLSSISLHSKCTLQIE